MNPTKVAAYPRHLTCKKCGRELVVPGQCSRCSLVSRAKWSVFLLVAIPLALIEIKSRAPDEEDGNVAMVEGLGTVVMLGAGFVLVTVLLELFVLARRQLRRRIK